MEDSKELIIKYFFIEHLKVKEIAEIVHTSSSYITKIIKQDERYSEEKKYRCNKSKEKRKKDQNRFIKHKREQKRIDDNFAFVEEQHRHVHANSIAQGYLPLRQCWKCLPLAVGEGFH